MSGMRGFLFDAQCREGKVLLWVKTAAGMVRLEDDYSTYFYAKHVDMDQLERKLGEKGLEPILEEMPTIYNETEKVYRIPASLEDFTPLVRWLEREYRYDIELFNCDIPLNQRYLYDRNLMPCHQVEFAAENGKLLVKALESLLIVFGYCEERIREQMEHEKQMLLNYYAEPR